MGLATMRTAVRRARMSSTTDRRPAGTPARPGRAGPFLCDAGKRGDRRYNATMHITLNGSPRDCANATTVAQLLQEAGYGDRRVAVEVNHQIVPRSQHANHVLAQGDQVEIVHAIGGG